jgi:hypothetical protein
MLDLLVMALAAGMAVYGALALEAGWALEASECAAGAGGARWFVLSGFAAWHVVLVAVPNLNDALAAVLWGEAIVHTIWGLVVVARQCVHLQGNQLATAAVMYTTLAAAPLAAVVVACAGACCMAVPWGRQREPLVTSGVTDDPGTR